MCLRNYSQREAVRTGTGCQGETSPEGGEGCREGNPSGNRRLNRLTTGRHSHIRVWLWQSQTGTPTSVNKPGPTAALRAGRGEYGKRHVGGGGEGEMQEEQQQQVLRRPAALRVPEAPCAAKRGQTSAGLKIQVCVHWPGPFFTGETWFHSTRSGRTLHARQFHVCPYLVFLHLQLSSKKSSLLVLERVAAGTSWLLAIPKLITFRRRQLRVTVSCFLASPTLPSDIPACRRSGTQ
jgi:hypothetical protein